MIINSADILEHSEPVESGKQGLQGVLKIAEVINLYEQLSETNNQFKI